MKKLVEVSDRAKAYQLPKALKSEISFEIQGYEAAVLLD